MKRHADPLVGHRLSPPPEPGAVRRRTVRHRVWGLCAAPLGITMLLLGAAGLADVPDLIEDEKAFGAATRAPPCPLPTTTVYARSTRP
ncbi:hypothetical protein ABT063_34125 [Streptomyces sp. NPDC002838]|uniref:hypothetical protein n=1 Tax=Streptomyces sp. NPDC002838 TaxID=3154436 RepID=UPI00332C7852